jgi:hypothetical protein
MCKSSAQPLAHAISLQSQIFIVRNSRLALLAFAVAFQGVFAGRYLAAASLHAILNPVCKVQKAVGLSYLSHVRSHAMVTGHIYTGST